MNTLWRWNVDGTVETVTAEKFVIACGSRPYHPADVDFSTRASMTAIRFSACSTSRAT
jgi:pyruvate/2-oxoglutarate dehydrogenase complex dihydrolipoamide dehydrogenase (E3) component